MGEVGLAKVTVLPGEGEPRGEGDGGVEELDSDDLCLCREVEGASSSLYASNVIMFY